MVGCYLRLMWSFGLFDGVVIFGVVWYLLGEFIDNLGVFVVCLKCVVIDDVCW